VPILTPASDGSGAFEQLISQAGFGQVIYPPNSFPVPLPLTIAGSGLWNSGLLFPDGYRNLTIGVTSSQTATLVVTMYLDLAGTIVRPLASPAVFPASTPLTAATAMVYDWIDISPFLSMTVQITNGSTATTLSGFQLILSAG
jgi:hypothetical protein